MLLGQIRRRYLLHLERSRRGSASLDWLKLSTFRVCWLVLITKFYSNLFAFVNYWVYIIFSRYVWVYLILNTMTRITEDSIAAIRECWTFLKGARRNPQVSGSHVARNNENNVRLSYHFSSLFTSLKGITISKWKSSTTTSTYSESLYFRQHHVPLSKFLRGHSRRSRERLVKSRHLNERASVKFFNVAFVLVVCNW